MYRTFWRSLGTLGRIPQRGPAVSVVCLHQVLASFDRLRPSEPDAIEFETLVRGLQSRFDMISLSEVSGYLAGRRSGHAVALTFDDGYENNFSIARPILKRLQVPATIFVATGFLNRGCMWNDLVIESVRRLDGLAFDWPVCDIVHEASDADVGRLALISKILGTLKHREPGERDRLTEQLAARAGITQPPALMMTEDEVVELDNDAEFVVGAHTDQHPILAVVSDKEAVTQIELGKAKLENLLGRAVDQFAYPNGRPGDDFLAAHVRMVRDAGFNIAVTTSPGAVMSGSSSLQWPRQNIWSREPLRASLSLLRGSRQAGQVLPIDLNVRTN